MLVLPKWADALVTKAKQKNLKFHSVHKTNTKTFLFFTVKTPFIVYKKVARGEGYANNNRVISLALQKGTILCMNSFSNKVRASAAKVMPHAFGDCYAGRDKAFQYLSDAVVMPNGAFDMQPTSECASGIHFFFNRVDADNWKL